MTVQETINTLRMLMDDGWDWYQGTQYVLDAINESQVRVLDEAIMAGDEKCVRPLVRHNTVMDKRNRTTGFGNNYIEHIDFDTANRRLIHTYLSCIVYLNNRIQMNNDKFGLQAQYQPIQTFLNFDSQAGPYFDDNDIYFQIKTPNAIYYTTGRDSQGFTHGDWIMFTNGGLLTQSRAELIYVVYPLDFAEEQPLELPQEYHFKVCTYAAELINNSDVAETMRGKNARAEFGQKLNIENLSKGNPNVGEQQR